MKLAIDGRLTAGIIIASMLIFALVMFGLPGMVTAVGIAAFFVVPFYLISSCFFPSDEALFFSFFLGIGFFSSMVYYLSFFTGLRLAIGGTFLVLLLAGLIFKK